MSAEKHKYKDGECTICGQPEPEREDENNQTDDEHHEGS